MTIRVSRNILVFSLAGILSAAAATAAPADRRRLEREGIRKAAQKEAAVAGRTVAFDGAASSLEVRPGEGDRLAIRGELLFWSNDRDLMSAVEREFEVRLIESAGRIDIEADLPPSRSKKGLFGWLKETNVSYSLDLEVTVPSGTTLQIRNRYGSVEVAGVGGPLQIDNESGSITVSGASGSVVLDGRYGEIAATGITGDLKAATASGGIVVSFVSGDARLNSSYGHVSVEDVGGSLTVAATAGRVECRRVGGRADLSTSFGNVEAEEIGRDLTVSVQSGRLRASRVRGSLKAQGSYGDVTAEEIGGPAEIVVTSGGVTADGIEGDLTVRSSFGAVRARRVEGDLSVTAASSPVRAETIAGGIQIETSHAAVEISGAGGPIKVRNQSGAVVVEGLRGAALQAEHDIQTSFASIVFDWPRGRPVSYTVSTSFGGIETTLPGRLRESGSGRSLEGSRGTGGAVLRLATQSGGVVLKEE